MYIFIVFQWLDLPDFFVPVRTGTGGQAGVIRITSNLFANSFRLCSFHVFLLIFNVGCKYYYLWFLKLINCMLLFLG